MNVQVNIVYRVYTITRYHYVFVSCIIAYDLIIKFDIDFRQFLLTCLHAWNKFVREELVRILYEKHSENQLLMVILLILEMKHSTMAQLGLFCWLSSVECCGNI